MSELSPRLSLPYLMAAQAQKHVTLNEALQRLDLLTQLTVQGFGATVPPPDPDEGQVWALGPVPDAAWSGQGGRLAARIDGDWLFLDPQPGWRAVAGTDLRVFDGADWVAPDLPVLDNLPGVGINAAHDPTNRLTVSAAATLFSHEGAGHQLKLNKAAAGDTASLLFQTGWSGRAEMGTAGSDDFSVKVSPDGSTWHDGLVIDRTNGAVMIPGGAVVSGSLAGTAVMQSAIDTTAGRLMTVGAFGLGPSGRALNNTHDLNDLGHVGYFHWTAGGGVPANAPGSFAAGMLNIRRDGNIEMQMLMRTGSGTNNAATYLRSRISGNWQPWILAYNQNNVVGTVSQSSGVPTGAVIERGSNANGQFTRFADGTQLCWGSVTITPVADTPTSLPWTFPAAFASAGASDLSIVVSAVTAVPGSALVEASISGQTTTGCDVVVYRTNTTNTGVRCLAIGRWF